jgi:hypothetical protein
MKRGVKMEVEFKAWPKIPRGQNESVSITEKIDGTNACIIINKDSKIIGVQSRKRLITPKYDNYGFAGWVKRNRESLETMGEGYHYGEWAGLGIQKNHHGFSEKQLMLFNTQRWNPNNPNLPDCCSVVPLLYEGDLESDTVDDVMIQLRESYIGVNTQDNLTLKPEGVVVWYHKTRRYAKFTFEDQGGKWKKEGC